MEKESNKYQQKIDFRRCELFPKLIQSLIPEKLAFRQSFIAMFTEKCLLLLRRLRALKRSRTDSTHILSCSTGKEIAPGFGIEASHKALQNQESVNSAQRGFSVFTKLKAHYWERVSLRCFPGNLVEQPRHHEIYNRRMITWSCYESVPCQKFCHLSQVAGVLRFCCTCHCCCCFTVENHVCHQSRSRSLALGQLCVAVARYHKRNYRFTRAGCRESR